jgi:hypothetical protein
LSVKRHEKLAKYAASQDKDMTKKLGYKPRSLGRLYIGLSFYLAIV